LIKGGCGAASGLLERRDFAVQGMRLEVGSMNGKPLLRIFGDHGPPDSGLLDFDLLPPGSPLGTSEPALCRRAYPETKTDADQRMTIHRFTATSQIAGM